MNVCSSFGKGSVIALGMVPGPRLLSRMATRRRASMMVSWMEENFSMRAGFLPASEWTMSCKDGMIGGGADMIEMDVVTFFTGIL